MGLKVGDRVRVIGVSYFRNNYGGIGTISGTTQGAKNLCYWVDFDKKTTLCKIYEAEELELLKPTTAKLEHEIKSSQKRLDKLVKN